MTDLNEQLAAISVVKSTELMEMATDSRELNNITNQVLSSSNRVMEIKDLLEQKANHEISPEDAITIDGQLSELKVINVEDGEVTYNEHRVAGAEAFGLTLRPSEFRASRIAACENFLSEALESAKVFTKRLVQTFQDAYTLAVEDTESLIQRFKMIERASKDLGSFDDGLERFRLSARLFNLLKVNSEVREDWYDQILSLYKTSSALTGNYYDYSEKELTQIMAFFSRFEGMTEEYQITSHLMLAGNILNSPPFRECKFDVSDKKVPWLRSLRSVELMGGRYLIDTRWKEPLKIRDIKTIDDWFDSRIQDIGVRLNKRDSIDFIDREQEIDTFGSDTIRHICQISIKILESWLAICQKANKHRISERDFESIGDAINAMPVEGTEKHRVMAMYSLLVRKNQQDLLDICSDFTRYLVITLNAIASLCNDSINYAKSVK